MDVLEINFESISLFLKVNLKTHLSISQLFKQIKACCDILNIFHVNRVIILFE